MRRVLVGCERSGIIRRAFAARGFHAWSCDLEPSEDGSEFHLIADVREVVPSVPWDLVILHPPCTFLCRLSSNWYARDPYRWLELEPAAAFFGWCLDAAPRVVVENPVMFDAAKRAVPGYRPPDMTFHPWQFGSEVGGPDDFTKRTLLWLRDVPRLRYGGELDGSTARQYIRAARDQVDRSRFFPGVAAAMADQWGDYLMTRSPRRFV